MAANQYQQLRRLADRILDPSVRDVLYPLIALLADKEPLTMADIQQALTDLGSAVQGVADRAAEDHQNLQTQIDELKAAGVDTGQLQQIADSIEGHVTALNQIDPVTQVPTDGGATDGGATDGGTTGPTEPTEPDVPTGGTDAGTGAATGDGGTATDGGTTAPADGGTTAPDVPADGGTTAPDVPADGGAADGSDAGTPGPGA